MRAAYPNTTPVSDSPMTVSTCPLHVVVVTCLIASGPAVCDPGLDSVQFDVADPLPLSVARPSTAYLVGKVVGRWFVYVVLAGIVIAVLRIRSSPARSKAKQTIRRTRADIGFRHTTAV